VLLAKIRWWQTIAQPNFLETLMQCIWCKDPDPVPSFEEIILASLGGPYGFTFESGEVCRPCNNGLGHLDQAVADELDMFAFHMGTTRRGGRRAGIQNRGNLRAYLTDRGPVIAVNLECHPVTTPDGVYLAAPRGGQRNVRAHLERRGIQPNLTISTPLGANPKFARGIHKMAFELLAFQIGVESVMDVRFDPIRAFVTEGIGTRHVLLSPNQPELVRIEPGPLTDGRGGYVVRFCIVGVDFAVDLTPTQEALPKLIERFTATFGNDNWMCCPPRAA
jgi:hypothetical protein